MVPTTTGAVNDWTLSDASRKMCFHERSGWHTLGEPEQPSTPAASNSESVAEVELPFGTRYCLPPATVVGAITRSAGRVQSGAHTLGVPVQALPPAASNTAWPS